MLASTVWGIIDNIRTINPFPAKETYSPPLINSIAKQIFLITEAQASGNDFVTFPKQFLATQPIMIIATRGGIVTYLMIGLR